MRIFPNPYAANPVFANNRDLIPRLKSERSGLAVRTRVFVLFAGGIGTSAEFELALEKECQILIGINRAEDYDNPLIQKMLKDRTVAEAMKKRTSEYYQCLINREVPTMEMLVNATKAFLS